MNTRTIFRNFGFLTSGTLVGDLSTLLLLAVLSRHFGPEGVGLYGVAIGLVGFLVAFADFGLGPLTIRETSLRWEEAEFPRLLFTLRILLTGVAFLVLLLIVTLFRFAPLTARIVLIIGIRQLLHQIAEGLGQALLAWNRPEVDSVAGAASKGVGALAGICIAVAGGSLTMALTPLALTAGAHFFVVAWAVHRRVGGLRLVWDIPALWKLARAARPFVLSGFLWQISARIDILLVSFMMGTAAAGLYHTAYRVVTAILWIPRFASLALFPFITRTHAESPNRLRTSYRRALGSIALIALPAAVGLLWTAPRLIQLLFGEGFGDSVFVLRILSLLVFTASFVKIMSVYLLAARREEALLRHQWKVALVTVAGTLILVPRYGIEGAAVAICIAQALLLVLFSLELKEVVGRPRPGSRLGIALLGTAVFSGVLALLPTESLAARIATGFVMYCLVLLGFREIRTCEAREIMDWLKSITRFRPRDGSNLY